MRSSDWSSDVCSSDLWVFSKEIISCLTSDFSVDEQNIDSSLAKRHCLRGEVVEHMGYAVSHANRRFADLEIFVRVPASDVLDGNRSEEHTSELQSLMRISYAVFCLKKKKHTKQTKTKLTCSKERKKKITHSLQH